MNPLHLIWIIPLSGGFGVFCMALVAGGQSKKHSKEKGVSDDA